MRKGDEKRQEILNAAEKLFCSRGYDATSVQDILNVLHASKGGFYHHFTSKEEVLRTLCAQRAERAAAYTAAQLEHAAPGMGRINAVLHGYIPFRREEAAFIRLLLPMIDSPDGRALAMTYQDALYAAFLPLLEAEISAASAGDAMVCPPVKDMEAVLLHLANCCWLDIARHLLHILNDDIRYDPAVTLGILERYRRSVEILLDAPYGSIELLRIEEADEVAHRLMRTFGL